MCTYINYVSQKLTANYRISIQQKIGGSSKKKKKKKKKKIMSLLCRTRQKFLFNAGVTYYKKVVTWEIEG